MIMNKIPLSSLVGLSMELITHVAIKWTDIGFVKKLEKPYRHHDILNSFHKTNQQPKGPSIQGFWTDHNRFVDRFEGLILATKSGQIIHKTPPDDRLFSDDMW